MNLWDWLLAGLLWLIQTLIMPLFGTASSQTSAVGLANAMGSGAFVVLQLTWAGFSTFNLTWFWVWAGVTFFFKSIQLIVSIYLFIKNLIPAAN